ncbi:hypothetical protein [Vibrio sp. F74]|uniref:hypothetical protein n=1 Tax=Vibrio sp. F74 TaxID=700020 RepID=UPI0035F57DF1
MHRFFFFVAEPVEGDFIKNTEISDIGYFPLDKRPILSHDRALDEDIRSGYRAFSRPIIDVQVD